MSRTVNCVLLKKEAEGLDYAPYPGELGQRIYDNVSKEAWQRWLAHQTMLINEYRLTPIEPEARKFLETEMEKFFFRRRLGETEGIRAALVSGGRPRSRKDCYVWLRGDGWVRAWKAVFVRQHCSNRPQTFYCGRSRSPPAGSRRYRASAKTRRWCTCASARSGFVRPQR